MTRRHFTIAALAILIGGATWVAQTLGQTDPAVVEPAATTTQSPCCVGIVDFVRIFNESEQIKDLNDLIRKQEVEVQTEAKQRQEVIENKTIELGAFRPGSPDYQSRRKDLIRLGTEANVWLKVAEQDLESQKFDWTRMIYEKSNEIVAAISKERGFSVVLQYKAFSPDDSDQTLATIKRMIQDRTVVYKDESVDITADVLKRLNDAYRAGGGKKQLNTPSSATSNPNP